MLTRLLCLMLIACCFGLLGCAVDHELPQVTFDSTKWKSAIGHNNTERSSMVDNLVESKKLIGLTKPQIVELLGETNDLHNLEEFDLSYLVGRDRGFGIDFEYVGIRLDENGKADEVEIVQR